MKTAEVPKWLELPVEERLQKVMEEIALNRARNQGKVDLNNFYCLFFPTDHHTLANGRDLIIGYAGNMDSPIHSGHSEFQTEGYSQVFLYQTPRQFFELVDRITGEQHIDMEHKNVLLAEYFQKSQGDVARKKDVENTRRQGAIVDELNEMLLPVYIELRILGYNDTDLEAN